MIKVGFIGFGEAAYNISCGLKGEGITGILAFDAMADDPVMGKLIRSRAEEAQVSLAEKSQEIALKADLIISAVPASNALEIGKELQNYLRHGQLYVDVSSATPKVKQQIGEIVEKTGASFVDAAMLGSLPSEKHRVPIAASGSGARQFNEKMSPYGMKISVVGEKAGSAAAIKMVRSIFMKGIAALMLEMLQAAETYGVEEEVIASISKSMDNIPFNTHLDRLVTGTALHCKRRAEELTGSLSLLEEADLEGDMTKSSKKWHERLIPCSFPARFVERNPEGWKEIIGILRH